MVFDARVATLRPRRAVESAIQLPFAPSIVWHCLVDPVLADGWLAMVQLDDVVGGRFHVVWPTGEPHDADWLGTIRAIEPLRRLLVGFDPHTSVLFEITGGHAGEGRSCAMRVRHESFLTIGEEQAVREFWRGRLDNLFELMHGRPVDWNSRASG